MAWFGKKREEKKRELLAEHYQAGREAHSAKEGSP